MLLIPFIENTFKHGVNKNIGVVNIHIEISIEEKDFYFKVSNTLPDKNLPPRKGPGGIGIANIRKRLELGYNEEDYNLDIYTNEKEHVVELKLKLK